MVNKNINEEKYTIRCCHGDGLPKSGSEIRFTGTERSQGDYARKHHTWDDKSAGSGCKYLNYECRDFEGQAGCTFSGTLF
ncbi:hypothetical protein D3C85_1604760 [compost metagenome]